MGETTKRNDKYTNQVFCDHSKKNVEEDEIKLNYHDSKAKAIQLQEDKKSFPRKKS